MKYQVVVQFKATLATDFNRLVAGEQNLSAALGSSAVVDGHDFGSGEFNIFVLTDTPATTFEQIQEMFRKEPPREQMRAAYRELGGEDYTILWPPNLKEFSVG